jgi:hypothetical protein
MQWHMPKVAQQVYQLAGLTASVPKPITDGHFILKADYTSLGSGQWKSRTANWFWFKLADGLRLNFYLPEGS